MNPLITRRADSKVISEHSDLTCKWFDVLHANKITQHGKDYSVVFVKSQVCSETLTQLVILPSIIESVIAHYNKKELPGLQVHLKITLKLVRNHLQSALKSLIKLMIANRLIEQPMPREMTIFLVVEQIEESINQGIKNGRIVSEIVQEANLRTTEPADLVGLVFESIKDSTSENFTDAIVKITTLACMLEIQLRSWGSNDEPVDFLGTLATTEIKS